MDEHGEDDVNLFEGCRIAVIESAAFMAAVAFGRFTLIDLRGTVVGAVIVAPECILLQRGPAARARDVSYLALWTDTRIAAIATELATLARLGPTTVDARTPELHAILHAIAPAASALFVASGRCSRRFARTSLKAALARPAPRRDHAAGTR